MSDQRTAITERIARAADLARLEIASRPVRPADSDAGVADSSSPRHADTVQQLTSLLDGDGELRRRARVAPDPGSL